MNEKIRQDQAESDKILKKKQDLEEKVRAM